MAARSSLWRARSVPFSRAGGAFALLAAALLVAVRAEAEPAACLAPNPSSWPAPAKPYFLIAFDTSGSMTGSVAGPANSCGYPNTRIGHAKCALKNIFTAFGGQVNFGLMAFARGTTTGCIANCGTDGGGSSASGTGGMCSWTTYPNGNIPVSGCGPEPDTSQPYSADRRGGEILVPMQVDNFYAPPLAPSNLPELLKWVDNDCSQNGTLSYELWADGQTPLNGILRDAYRYLSDQWTRANGAITYPSPIAASGERACRTIRVLLITDGDESCDSNPADPIDAAADLFAGFTRGGITWSVKTHVIGIAGNISTQNVIAQAGGTGAAVSGTNESALSTAIANIIAGAIKPETCDNFDNDCNGCTDEGYLHYCNQGQTCCAWSTTVQRTACLDTYRSTISGANPSGDVTLLPCTTSAQLASPASWLCYDPKDVCDGVDNNCQGNVDEGTVKCGNPLHCATAESCNGVDDDCDGAADDGLLCPGVCPAPSQEICDGCDNDCDGVVDDGAPGIPCGLPSPPNCVGTRPCKPAQNTGIIGGCAVNAGPDACNNDPQPEVCDGIDNDCDGIPDDGIAPAPCTPPNTPAGLVYGGTSQCVMGSKPCNGSCQGFVGPSAEICDGIDNDCDGQVDEASVGAGAPCGVGMPPCKAGSVACVNGALACVGGVLPASEICDGIDNDCDGLVDETPLADGPSAGQNGCWTAPGSCCTFQNLTWCPPEGADCMGVGALAAPCSEGKLVCKGAAKWACEGEKAPSAELCNGLDDDCDGQIDDGPLPGEGGVCGKDEGQCTIGTRQCKDGVIACVGNVEPTPEVCDGVDNDCDGSIDEGVNVTCTPAYDKSAFPGDRSYPPCSSGKFECNGAAGASCVGGTGPVAEVCDGIDNDCDGLVDEAGAPPDGIDGTTSPSAPGLSIGEACGSDAGACEQGQYGCVSGKIVCVGSTPTEDESCDCKDNDCDGKIDESDPAGAPICGTGTSCVEAGGACRCASPCGDGAHPCPPGQVCMDAVSSETGDPLGKFCLPGETTTSSSGAGGGGTGGGGSEPIEPGGCACRVGDGAGEGRGAWALAALLFAGRRRRARRGASR